MFKNFVILNKCNIFVHKLKTCNPMNTRKTTKGKFTNMICEYNLIIKAISQTLRQKKALSMSNR